MRTITLRVSGIDQMKSIVLTVRKNTIFIYNQKTQVLSAFGKKGVTKPIYLETNQ
jgi:hypothetical protein